MRILEVGIGRRPAISIGMELHEGDQYVGIDSGYLPNDAWHGTFTSRDALEIMTDADLARPRQANFLAASGTALPFDGDTFDRVQIGNVFGAYINKANQSALLAEFRRVLRETGRLVIAETISPLSLEKLKPCLEENNFTVCDVYKPGQPNYLPIARQYGIKHSVFTFSPQLLAQHPSLNTDYIATFRPKTFSNSAGSAKR